LFVRLKFDFFSASDYYRSDSKYRNKYHNMHVLCQGYL